MWTSGTIRSTQIKLKEDSKCGKLLVGRNMFRHANTEIIVLYGRGGRVSMDEHKMREVNDSVAWLQTT